MGFKHIGACFNVIPKISIIIPVFNLETVIEDTLNSIVNQTFTDFEVILIDDGSTDHTCKIIKKICDKDFRFKLLVQKQNYGVSIARNRGIDVARGEFIEFVDGDDQLREDALSQINDKISNEIDSIVINYQITDPNGKILKPKVINSKELDLPFLPISGYYALKKLFEGSINHIACSIVVRRSMLINKNITFPNGRNFGEDFATTYQILFYSRNVAFVRNNIYLYMQRSGSATHSKKLKNSFDYYLSVKEIDDFVETNAPNLKALSDLYTIKRLLNAYSNQMSFPINKQNKLIKMKIYNGIKLKQKSLKKIHSKLSPKNLMKIWLIKFKLLRFAYFIRSMKGKLKIEGIRFKF